MSEPAVVERGWTARNVEAARVVCGREVVRALPGGRSLLAQDGLGKLVVVKPLPRDCVVGGPAGELHGHVRDRLLRVRELADVRVAALYGVEVDELLGPVLVWAWVEGEDLPTAISKRKLSVLDVARAVVGGVEKLHLLGIVHGALHLRNVIVTPGEQFVLTHISPLVIDDPRRDAADVIKLLRELNARPGAKGSAAQGEGAVLARIIAECQGTPELSTLREKLLQAQGTRFVGGQTTVYPGRLTRSFWAAVGLIIAAVGVAGAVVLWASRQANGH